MVSITLSVSEEFKAGMKSFAWVNWSEVAREEALKKDIFEEYIKSGRLSDEDWEFCQEIDWHPVDELPLKEEFRKRIESAKREKSIRLKSVEEIFE